MRRPPRSTLSSSSAASDVYKRQFEGEFSREHGHAPVAGPERQPIANKYEVYRALKKFVRANAAIRIQATFRGLRGRLMAARVQPSSPAADLSLTARPEAPRSPSVEHGTQHEDELEGYLQAAQQRLVEDQQSARRPKELSHMSLAQKESEKSFVKHELKRFDDLLTMSLGRPLRKADKEPMRPLYSRYHELKKSITEHTGEEEEEEVGWPVRKGLSKDHYGALKDHSNAVQQSSEELAWNKPATVVAAEQPVQSKAAVQDQYATAKAQKRQLQQRLHQYENDFYKKHGRKMKHHEDIAPVQAEYAEYKKLKTLVLSLEKQIA
eukprot:TRINITY_DN28341_c0_g1_i2.p1 TRINITY_DN28341_c0_g1~~TRINITY_DN28341_c0_g1_i2.p1  ORF type:complete len:323 (+),score=103.56 TRINITY_DN28341_c0_g1_i2:72-1040(+)